MIEELDNVELTEDFEYLKKGTKGAVVYMGGRKDMCMVEFFSEGKTISVKVVKVEKLKKI